MKPVINLTVTRQLDTDKKINLSNTGTNKITVNISKLQATGVKSSSVQLTLDNELIKLNPTSMNWISVLGVKWTPFTTAKPLQNMSRWYIRVSFKSF